MGVNQSVSRVRFVFAMFSAALVGWSVLTLPLIVPGLLEGQVPSALSGLVLLAMFGIPIATVATFVIGTPVALFALRRGWISLPAAIGLGGLVGGLIGSSLLGWELLTLTGSFGGSEGMLWVDGWPTALGWQNEVGNLGKFILAGLLAGPTARLVAIR